MTLIEKIKEMNKQSSDEQKEEVKNPFMKQAEARKKLAELLKKRFNKENKVNE